MKPLLLPTESTVLFLSAVHGTVIIAAEKSNFQINWGVPAVHHHHPAAAAAVQQGDHVCSIAQLAARR